MTIKHCKYCHLELINNGQKNFWKKQFCNPTCQQEWWSVQRNKSGRFRKGSYKLSNKIRLTYHLSNKQIQIVYGGMLGDSSISARENGQCRMQMSHCKQQLPYLEFKKEILKPFIIQESATIDKQRKHCINGKTFQGNTCFHYSTIQHQDFTDLYGLFYRVDKGKKRRTVNMNILNDLKPLGILIWYLDDGTYYNHPKKGKSIHISTVRYNLSEQKTMKKWLWHKYHIEVKISYDTIHNFYYLRMNKEAIKNFTKLILPYKKVIPSCMHYKFPDLNQF